MSWLPMLRRAGRRTNIALFVLLAGAFLSGWVAFAVAEPVPAALVTTAHGLLGLGAVALVPWKSVVVRRASHPRPSSLLLAVAVVACLAGGFVLVFGGYVDVLGITPIQLHVGGALVAVPLFVLHVVRHRHRQVPRRRDVSRRAALRTAGFAAATAAGYASLESVGRLVGSPSAQRIATGSHPLAPADVPATSWLLDRVPALDPATHRVDVAGRSMAVADLTALAGPVSARLDCTSGWYADETWTAVRLDRIVPASNTATIEIVSVTGYSRLFPAAEVAQLWLAVAREGQVLPAGRGAPVRLVVPGRRGVLVGQVGRCGAAGRCPGLVSGSASPAVSGGVVTSGSSSLRETIGSYRFGGSVGCGTSPRPSGDTMTQAPAGPPLYMRRNGFDPTPELREIRENDGIRRIRGAFDLDVYLVTRHDDVKEALADATRFSNRRPPQFSPFLGDMTAEEIKRAQAGNLLGMDPPEHHRLRRMLTPEFTLRRMKRIEPRIVEIVDEHLDALERAGAPADLVAEFALPIPSLVICELLGVPYADRAGFQARTARQLDFSVPMSERAALQREGREYMDALVTAARQDPGEDMLGMLVREHGDELTQDELVGIANLLLIAGHETTSNMLGLGTLAFLQHPDQLAIVRDEPEAIGPAVEELMRWLSIVHSGIPRFTHADTELGGVPIPANSIVILSLPSANRDPSATEDPDTFDVRRGVPGHLAFGHGVHHCLGAPLARMEMRIAFPALLRRFPRLALAGDPADVPFRAYHFIYGLQSLEVTW